MCLQKTPTSYDNRFGSYSVSKNCFDSSRAVKLQLQIDVTPLPDVAESRAWAYSTGNHLFYTNLAFSGCWKFFAWNLLKSSLPERGGSPKVTAKIPSLLRPRSRELTAFEIWQYGRRAVKRWTKSAIAHQPRAAERCGLHRNTQPDFPHTMKWFSGLKIFSSWNRLKA